MRKFAFRLQKVMDFRRWREKTEQQLMAEAATNRDRARRELVDVVAVADEHNGKRVDQNNTFSAGDALRSAEYSKRLFGDIKEHEGIVADRDRELDQQREELVVASQGRKIIEKLKERRFNQYRKTIERTEQAILDDIAGQRHVKKGCWTD